MHEAAKGKAKLLTTTVIIIFFFFNQTTFEARSRSS